MISSNHVGKQAKLKAGKDDEVSRKKEGCFCSQGKRINDSSGGGGKLFMKGGFQWGGKRPEGKLKGHTFSWGQR